MSPPDPRWPSPAPFTPHFRPPPGYGESARQPPAAAPPLSHGYPQHPHQPPEQAHYAQHAGHAPSPPHHAQAAYPHAPYPQAAHPHAAYPQTAYPQATPQYAGPAMQRKGRGIGTLIAVLAVVVVVIGSALGVGAFLLYGPTAKLSDDVDQSAALQQNVQALMTAVRTGDPKKVEDPLLALAILPDRAGLWFRETFGPELGQRLQQEWERDVFAQLPALIKPFKEANANGQTEIRVRRVTSIQPGTDKFEQNVLRARKQKRALYVVTLVHPGQQYGDSVYYFALVDGRFGYVGHMVSAW